MFKRGQIWWTKFKNEGKVFQKSLETSDRKLAEKIEAKIKTQIVEGKYFDVPMGKEKTFTDLMERYLSTCSTKKAPRSLERDTMVFRKHLFPFFGAMPLTQIKPSILSDYKALRLKTGIVNETLSKELALLKAAYNVAIREWEWVKENPVCKIRLERTSNGIVRFLHPGEFERLYEAAPDWMRPMMQVARFTGMRQGNLLALEWKDVDLIRGVIILGRTKNGEPHGIPICDPLRKVFEELKEKNTLNSPHVFHAAKGHPVCASWLKNTFRRTRKKAGIVDFRWHDFRHDFASQLVQNGVDLLRVQKLLGHKTASMTLRYAHLAPENLRQALTVFNKDGYNLATVKACEKETKS